MISAQEALERLREGNRRFVAGVRDCGSRTDEARRAEVARGQKPWAIILGCSDSRVPVELVFDQGLGDLFVVRVAGNVAAPSQVGSIESGGRAIRHPPGGGAWSFPLRSHHRCAGGSSTTGLRNV